MSNTANWLLAVSGTKACQTISGLVKTRGHLIMLRHAIGWNLRVCLLWLTGVESSIKDVQKQNTGNSTVFLMLLWSWTEFKVTERGENGWSSTSILYHYTNFDPDLLYVEENPVEFEKFAQDIDASHTHILFLPHTHTHTRTHSQLPYNPWGLMYIRDTSAVSLGKCTGR